MTGAQLAALAAVPDEWTAGPELPIRVIDRLLSLREAGFVERRFGDEVAPSMAVHANQINVRLSACWFFRRTDAGRTALDRTP